MIFPDRYHGYHLSTWEVLPRQFSFSLACHLAWSRSGGYSYVYGTVAELTGSGLMKVAERVTLLTYDIRSRLRDVVALLVDQEKP